MAEKYIEDGTVADAYLELLADRGIEYFFGNAGTDFAPLIESFAKANARGTPVPKPITVPHENLAIHMAMGYTVITGRPQVVMVHVNVGTANSLNGLINASRGNIPVIFSSGRTPYTETGDRVGLRTREVHWPQEMFDQGALTREMVKWDYELRDQAVLETVVDRALNIAMSEPRGPIYLTLPREPLAENLRNFSYQSPSRRVVPTAPYPDPNAIDRVASIIANAENPLIITQDSGANPEAVAPLAALADRFAIPVVQRKPRHLCLPSDHPMHLGYDSDPFLDIADVIIVAACDVPWIPSVKAPGPGCTVIQMGADPIYERYPIRGYECDIGITGTLSASFRMLDDALAELEQDASVRINARRRLFGNIRDDMHEKARGMLDQAKNSSPMHPAWIAHCINEIKGEDSIVCTESAFAMAQMQFNTPGSFFSGGAGGGLGYGLGMSLGAKLAAPDKLVICTQGDGAYMFGNPVPAHYVGKSENLPTLTVIMNNEQWGAVKRNTRAMYPDGYAVKSNREPLTFFEGGMQFEKAAEMAGGYGERVENAADLPKALERAVDNVMGKGRQAVLNLATL
jgi:acetolactate synthase-1/2/3 large subunit